MMPSGRTTDGNHVPLQGVGTLPATPRIADALARFCGADGNPWGVELRAETARVVRRPASLLHWCRVSGSGVSVEVVVKAAVGSSRSADRMVMVEAATARWLQDVFVGHAELGVVAPLRTYEDLAVVVTPAVSAPSLAEAIERGSRWWPSADSLAGLERGCELAGRWLQVLHLARPTPSTWSVDRVRSDLTVRMRLLGELPRAYGLPAHLARRLEHWIDAQLARAAAGELACSETHRDYSPSNMLYDGTRLWVLDLATFGVAPRALDRMRFLHQLELLGRKPWYRPGTRQQLQAGFTRGYGESGHPLDRVFTVRHTLSHWLGSARRVRRTPEAAVHLISCRLDRRDVERHLRHNP